MNNSVPEQLCTIAKLNGRFTEGVLVRRGISKTALARAVNFGLLRSDNAGMLESIPALFRHNRLTEAVAVDLTPGRQIGVLNPDTKQIMQRQVVSVNGNDVMVIDPLHPQQIPQKVSMESVAVNNERDGDNRPVEPNKAPPPPPEADQPPAPSASASMPNPTPTV